MRVEENVIEVVVPTAVAGLPAARIRVWFDRQGHSVNTDYVLLSLAVEMVDAPAVDPFDLAEQLLPLLERVNAIEVRRGPLGCLIYPEWP